MTTLAEAYLRDLDSLHKALKNIQLNVSFSCATRSVAPCSASPGLLLCPSSFVQSEASVVVAMRNDFHNKHGAGATCEAFAAVKLC